MKKRIIGMIMSMLMICSLVACGNTDTETGEQAHDHTHNEMQENVNSGSSDVVELKLALSAHEGEAHYKAAEVFAKEVEQKSNGTLKVLLCGSNSLGDAKNMLSAMEQGSDLVDIVVTSVSDYSEIDARMDISSLPFLFENYEDAWWFLDGDIQKEIEQGILEKNIRVLSYYCGGFDCITTGAKSINVAVEMQDLSLAVTEMDTATQGLQALGARVKVMQERQLMQVLDQNQCDGYAGSIASVYKHHLYQVQERVSMTYHRYDAMAFAISESVWKTLSAEQREIVKNAALNSSYTDRELIRQQEKEMIDEMVSSGVKVYSPNLSSFREKVESYIRNASSQYGILADRVIFEYLVEQ